MVEMIRVEVVLALPERQWLRMLSLPAGATVWQAVEASDLAAEAGGVLDRERLGVFGRRVANDTVLRDGDRVELYRPLLIEPMAARRRRAAQPR